MPCARRAFGALFDAHQLAMPMFLEQPRPFKDSAELLRIGAIKRLSTVAADVDKSDVQEHAEMLGHRRLREWRRTPAVPP